MCTKKLLAAFLPFVSLVLPLSCQAAMVDAQICLSITVLEQFIPNIISGSGGPVCTSVSGSAVAVVPGDTVMFTDTQTAFIAAGGTNTSGSPISYTMKFDWNYSIVTSALAPDESATALVRIESLGLEFTSGSGSGSSTVFSTIDNMMAVDYFGELYATGTAISTAPVPVPGSVALFASGLFGIAGLASRKRKSGC